MPPNLLHISSQVEVGSVVLRVMFHCLSEVVFCLLQLKHSAQVIVRDCVVWGKAVCVCVREREHAQVIVRDCVVWGKAVCVCE